MPVRPLAGGIAWGAVAPAFAALTTAPSIATNIYTPVAEGLAAVGLLQATSPAFFAFVPAGFRYRFSRTAGAGVTETVAVYNTIDLG